MSLHKKRMNSLLQLAEGFGWDNSTNAALYRQMAALVGCSSASVALACKEEKAGNLSPELVTKLKAKIGEKKIEGVDVTVWLHPNKVEAFTSDGGGGSAPDKPGRRNTRGAGRKSGASPSAPAAAKPGSATLIPVVVSGGNELKIAAPPGNSVTVTSVTVEGGELVVRVRIG